MDPFWELFEDEFCTKYEKMRTRRIPKNRCRKKAPPITQTTLMTMAWGSLTAPIARPVLNKKQQFQQHFDFCFENCPMWVETP